MDAKAKEEITVIPPLENPRVKVVEFAGINPPYAYARVTFNDESKDSIYEVIEPHLTEAEGKLLSDLKAVLYEILGAEGTRGKDVDRKKYLQGTLEDYFKSRSLEISSISRERLIYYILRDYVRYGLVDVLISDPEIEDISCNGVNLPIYVFHRKYESLRTNIRIPTEQTLNGFVVMLGQRCSKYVSFSNPILDGTTPEGHRIQATYATEVTMRGATFTIRRFKELPWTPVDLMLAGTANAEIMAYLWMAVETGESIMICGGPATGKTATLNAVAIFIPPTAKIVSLEDTREVRLPHDNWIPGLTRTGLGDRGVDGKAAGEVDMFDLVRAALRQRPNYIIVGEVRGKETYTMFQAMATGHATFSTMHADSVKSMANRLENPPINTPRILLSALRIVIIQSFVRLGNQTVRRIKEIREIVGFEPETNELITNMVYEWNPTSDAFAYKGHSFVLDSIMNLRGYTRQAMEVEFKKRVAVVDHLRKSKISDFRQIWQMINSYYREPLEVMKLIGYPVVPEEGTGAKGP